MQKVYRGSREGDFRGMGDRYFDVNIDRRETFGGSLVGGKPPPPESAPAGVRTLAKTC